MNQKLINTHNTIGKKIYGSVCAMKQEQLQFYYI